MTGAGEGAGQRSVSRVLGKQTGLAAPCDFTQEERQFMFTKTSAQKCSQQLH